MARVEVDLEITGFKLRIRGERQDIPAITNGIANQLNSIIPSDRLITVQPTAAPTPVTPSAELNEQRKPKKAQRSRRPSGNGAASDAPKPLAWTHQPDTWGMPRQAWSAGSKVLWLMLVAKTEAAQDQISSSVIAETFNSKFREAGTLKKTSMPSSLGALKQKSFVGSNNDVEPILWFLTNEGIKEAKKLVEEAKAKSQE